MLRAVLVLILLFAAVVGYSLYNSSQERDQRERSAAEIAAETELPPGVREAWERLLDQQIAEQIQISGDRFRIADILGDTVFVSPDTRTVACGRVITATWPGPFDETIDVVLLSSIGDGPDAPRHWSSPAGEDLARHLCDRAEATLVEMAREARRAR